MDLIKFFFETEDHIKFFFQLFMEFMDCQLIAGMLKSFALLLLIIVAGCDQEQKHVSPGTERPTAQPVYKTIGSIPKPQGFKKEMAASGSFAAWLRNVPLKKDKAVYLYNGRLKPNQSAQYAVIDIPVGNKDLQQCADAVMRLRAEYLYEERKYTDIAFMDYSNKWYKWIGNDNRPAFDNYLQTVFGWCGSASLEKQLKPVIDFNSIKAGDVFVQGGFPGHAMMVVDVAVNKKGNKVFMLAQGYQPAQDMHVVVNPMDTGLSPWYEVTSDDMIITPEWRFYKSQLREW